MGKVMHLLYHCPVHTATHDVAAGTWTVDHRVAVGNESVAGAHSGQHVFQEGVPLLRVAGHQTIALRLPPLPHLCLLISCG